jgi:XTP/dITP diphosphohydrolase
MKKITFVTQNKNKLADAQKLLSDFEVQHVDFSVDEVQSMDVREIIEHKLKQAMEKVEGPLFVMDASLSFSALNGFPGPLIKFFYEKIGDKKITEIINELGDDKCIWTNSLGYFDGEKIHFLEEVVEGKVPCEPRGENGFHWDTIFIPDGSTKTLAEMDFEEKQSYATTKKLFEKLSKIL